MKWFAKADGSVKELLEIVDSLSDNKNRGSLLIKTPITRVWGKNLVFHTSAVHNKTSKIENP